MKVYFSGSIRGGNKDAEIYEKIIALLKTKFVVLTEHIFFEKSNLTDIEIFNRDCEWIKECDFVIAEVSSPSLGVGYEIALAEFLNKPIVCFYRNQGKRLSAMLTGNKKLRIYEYDSIDELMEIMKNVIIHHGK